MPVNNSIINSNFQQIAVADADNNVWGIKAAIGNVQITGGTAGQVISSDGAGGLQWNTVGSAGSISNGTSNVTIPVTNGNVNTSVNGVANVLVVTSTGANVAGTANVTGTASFGANANVSGNLHALGNLVVNSAGSAGNVYIPGGTAGQLLSATGTGNLQWSTAIAPTAIQEFTATATGANQTFTLANSNLGTTSSSVYINGVLQRSTQYNIVGTTLTMIRTISTGDVVTVGPTTGALLPTYDWISAPTTITSTITNPTKGAVTTDYIRYKPLGNKTYLVEMALYTTTAGTAGNGIYLFNFPGGLVLDTTKQVTNTNGGAGGITTLAVWSAAFPSGSGHVVAAGNAGGLVPVAYDSTRFYLATVAPAVGGASYGAILSHVYFALNNSIVYRAAFTMIATT